MADNHDAEPTQETQPKKGQPVKIPVPKRKEVFELLRGVSGKRPPVKGLKD
jgi:hypothetical protein